MTTPATSSGALAAATPRHLGIILDGHRRWARAAGLPPEKGHRAGFKRIAEVLGWCVEEGIRVVTLWMLSDDNIANRSKSELAALYEIQEEIVGDLQVAGPWRLHHIGDESLLPGNLVTALRAAAANTRDGDTLLVNLAIGYGGRWDLRMAVQRLVADLRNRSACDVTDQQIAERLSTYGQPDPDLIIRPSGELRTSGFLIWQAALAELYFCPHLWPDFDRDDLTGALTSYRARHRRLGR